MKRINLIIILSAILLTFSISAVSFAQDKSDFDSSPPQNERIKQRNLLRDLSLTNEQIQQIRTLNTDRKSLRQKAQRRLAEAKRNLDQAIYADAVDEAAIQLFLKEVQNAHAEFFKIKTMDELEVRKILTPEQLVKFRELRERFNERMKNNRQRRLNRRQNQVIDKDSNPPVRRQNNRQKP